MGKAHPKLEGEKPGEGHRASRRGMEEERPGAGAKVLFEVVREALPYTPEVGRCALCRAEKLELVRVLGTHGRLNKRGELMGHCRHKWKHLLACVGARKGVG